MHPSSFTRVISILLVFICQPLFSQSQGELVTDKFFLKLRPESFSNTSRSNAMQIMDIPEIGQILSSSNMLDIDVAFSSIAQNQIDPYGLERIFVVSIQDDENILELIQTLNVLDEIEYAEPMYIRELYDAQFTPNDAYFSQSWHHPVVHTPEAWDIQSGSDTVVIAIIDTGVDTDHPDLVANLWNNPGEIADNLIDDDGNGKIDDIYGWDFTQDDADVNHEWNWHPYNAEDHGTHCAGIASGVTNNLIGIAGASQHSKIMACKIFPYLSDAAAANAITYAADNGADVISNSWGGGGSSNTIQSAILYARNVQGAMVLFAAGNDGSSSPHYPGANEGVVCVGATNNFDGRASFSNYGAWVDMCSPGTSIWSCVDPNNPAHNNQYAAWDGTSMATPLAAGIAALLKSQFPAMGVDALETRLLDGDDVGNLQMGLRVNAFKALTSFNISHSAHSNMTESTGPIPILAETFTDAGASLTVTLFYSISGAAYTSLGMVENLPGSWTAEIPSQANGAIIEYYIHAVDELGNAAYNPLSAPDVPHFFLIGSPGFFTSLIDDDVETVQGWEMGVPGDNATAGIWVRDEPIGTWEGLDPVQPEQDHSEAGSYCFVTGNVEFTGDNSGSGDVDGGRTTLLSPPFAIPPGVTAILSYWRWYSNDLGFNPGTDNWQVQIQDQSGIWKTLEQTAQSESTWSERQFLIQHYFESPSFVQLRFIAEDAGDGSLVEAAVDDIHLFYPGEAIFTPGDVNFDNLITIQDLILIVAHILGNATLLGDAAFAADYNLDAQINIQDVVSLVSAILD